jgi:hypothetical protein
VRFGGECFLGPAIEHRGEWPELVRLARVAPEASEKAGDHDILLGLGQSVERVAGEASFQQHSVDCVVGSENVDGRVAVPKARPSSSWSASKWGRPSLRMADELSAQVAGATQEALTCGPSKGAPSLRDQRVARVRIVSGSRASQAARSGVLRQWRVR